jgi:hypothetical protein
MITQGCTQTEYCPDDPVTRQQMAAFIMRALGELNPAVPSQPRFLDVPVNNPFSGFIDHLASIDLRLPAFTCGYFPSLVQGTAVNLIFIFGRVE